MTQRYMHLSPAALDNAIRLLEANVENRGDILETGIGLEGEPNGQNNLVGGEAGIRILRAATSNLLMARDFWL